MVHHDRDRRLHSGPSAELGDCQAASPWCLDRFVLNARLNSHIVDPVHQVVPLQNLLYLERTGRPKEEMVEHRDAQAARDEETAV